MGDSFESKLFKQTLQRVFLREATSGQLKMGFNAILEVKVSDFKIFLVSVPRLYFFRADFERIENRRRLGLLRKSERSKSLRFR